MMQRQTQNMVELIQRNAEYEETETTGPIYHLYFWTVCEMIQVSF